MTSSPVRPMPLSRGGRGGGARLAGGLRELALLVGLYIAYTLARVVADDDLPAARATAGELVRLERLLLIDVEAWLNQTVSTLTWVAVPMAYWYSVLHYVATPAALGWVYLRRRPRYAAARNALLIATVSGLVCYLSLPVAPPRLMSGSTYVDTLALYAEFGWWSDHASAPAGLGGLTNELAAMPSLHVGWAVWVAWAMGGRLYHLYPAGTAVVVVATGNHWVLDAVAGGLVAGFGIWAASRLESPTSSRPSTAPASATAPRPMGLVR